MAQTGYTPISLYYSTTASQAPTAGNLANGELAINITDGKLYYKDNTGTVKVIAGSGGTGIVAGSNTQIQFNNNGVFGASANLTWDGSFLTVASIKDSALTSGRVTYAGASGLLTDSANLTFNGTTLTAGGLTTTGTTSTGVLSVTGNSTLGTNTSNTLAVNALVNSNLLFTDNTYDIGASGATRPRNLFLGTSLTVTGTGTSPMYLGTGLTGISTYGLLTFNNDKTYQTTIGMYGGGGVDGNLYLNASSTSNSINLRINGADRFVVGLTNSTHTYDYNGQTYIGATNGNTVNATSRASLFATNGTVQAALISIGYSNSGYVGTVTNHAFDIFTNGGSRISISTAGLTTLGPTLPSASATYNALTVGGTGITIAPDGQAKLQIGRYSSGAPWSYLKPDSTSNGFKWTSNDDLNDIMSLRSSDGLLTLGVGTTIPGAWNGTYTGLTFGKSGMMGGKTNGSVYMFGNSQYLASGGWVAQTAGQMIGIFGVESEGPKVFVTGYAASAGQTLSPTAVAKWNTNGDMVLAGGQADSFSAQGRLTVVSDSSTYASSNDQAIWARNGTAGSGTIVAVNQAGSGNNILLDMYVNAAYNRIGTIWYYRSADTIAYGTGSPTTSAPFNPMFSKYGVTFNSSTIQSGDPNTLDDYEEGTWGPGISFGGTAASVSPSYGFYVKVGRQVTLTGYFVISSLNGGTGNAVVTGLPFIVGGSSEYYPGFYFGYVTSANFGSGYSGLSGYGPIGTKTIYIGSNNNLAWAQGTNTTIPNGTQIGPFTLTYTTTD